MMAHRNNDLGLSEVIGFVLLLALLIAAISLWMTYVVPAQGREQEISHMNYVGERFLDYKIAADSLWINDETGVTDSTLITLGSRGGNTQTSGLFLPLMQPIGSSGLLVTNTASDTITVSNSSGLIEMVPMSSLTYQSNNNYWIQQQFYYQMGGIFLSQDINGVTGVTNVVSPLVSIFKAGSTASVVIVPVQLNGGGTIAGEGNARVNFRLQQSQDYPVYNPDKWVNISVNVKDPETARMWRNLFRDIVAREQIASWTKDPNNNPGFYRQGSRGVAFINISSPSEGPSVILLMKRANFSMSLNTVTSS